MPRWAYPAVPSTVPAANLQALRTSSEHKMFETARGGDAETAFAALGAEVNAYTTYDRTVYLFSCTEGRAGSFDRALGALLRMVSGLHITPDSVEKGAAHHPRGDPHGSG